MGYSDLHLIEIPIRKTAKKTREAIIKRGCEQAQSFLMTTELHVMIRTDICHKIVKSRVKRVKRRDKLSEGKYWLSAEEL